MHVSLNSGAQICWMLTGRELQWVHAAILGDLCLSGATSAPDYGSNNVATRHTAQRYDDTWNATDSGTTPKTLQCQTAIRATGRRGSGMLI